MLTRHIEYQVQQATPEQAVATTGNGRSAIEAIMTGLMMNPHLNAEAALRLLSCDTVCLIIRLSHIQIVFKRHKSSIR